jgi:pyruvate carboxylase subunit B
MKYYVAVGDREIVVEVDGTSVSVDGRAAQAELTVVPGTPLRQLFFDGRCFVLSVSGGGRGAWVIGRHGEVWEAEALDERSRHIRALTGTGQGRRGAGTIRAPMPGLVVRVLVEPGQAVEEGAGVVVLEAMKMENELRAAGPGVVRTVRVEAGMAVEKGEVLVELVDDADGPEGPA